MFENGKNVILLQGALLSAANTNSGSLWKYKSLEGALSIVFHSVNKIINHNLVGIKEEKESIESEIKIHKQLHAAVFYTTLRSHGMTHSSLDSFYSSIANVWPRIDFKFYIELNFKFDWSDFFIKCASQLPSNILLQVIQTILDVSFSTQVKIYTWHLILQTLTLKLLEVSHEGELELSFKCQSMQENSPVKECQNIEITEEEQNVSEFDLLHEISQEEVMLLKEMYNNVCNLILEEMNKSKDVDLMKILLHEVKTLLKALLAERERDYKNISRFGDFMSIYNTLDNFLKLDDCLENLKVALNSSVQLSAKHSYAATSWGISTSYLCFLISYYGNKMYSDFSFKIELSIRNGFVLSDMVMNPFLCETLNTLNPLYVTGSKIDDEHLIFLRKILQLGFEGASFVTEILLSKPTFMEVNNMILVLEKNSYAVDFLKSYPSILQCIKAVTRKDSKLRLLKMFHKLLPRDNMKVYNDVLATILTEHGFTEEFELPDFSERLTQVFRTSLTIEQAEETFPALFIQNPLAVLKRVIDQTLIQGPDGRLYIEPLKYVQFVCTYQENKDSMPALMRILDDYLEKELRPWELNNMVMLYKFLMKLQSTRTHIIVLDVFLNQCIIPRLQHDMNKIELILECLCASITILIENKAFFIGNETLISLAISLAKLINDSILTQNGRLKSLVLPVIQALDKHQLESGAIKDADKEEIFCQLQSFHKAVCVYMKEFIPRNFEFSCESYLWMVCCNSKDFSHFEEQFSSKALSYPLLLQILVEVLPHLTKEEWLNSIELIKICCKKDALRNEILHAVNKPFDFSDCELNTYAVVSSLIACLHFILQENKDHVYLINCFTNCLMTLLNQEVKNTFLLMTVLLDCCYLAECVSPDLSSFISVLLLDLKKCIIASCSDKNYEDSCKKLISCAVKGLPNFGDDSALLTS